MLFPLADGRALAHESQTEPVYGFRERLETERVQKQLKAAGFDPGPIDGRFGPLTEAALREFQQHHGLPVTGALDDATRAALGLP
jgi:peptidoglycan hydrolase-like protein with peptidoglycan-binding domain